MSDIIRDARIVFLFESVQRGTMRAAAEALNVAPSAVTRQIALLEQELAIPLIERHTRGVKPTEAGKLLLDYFREQRSHQTDLLSQLEELRGLQRGTVRIALGEGFVSDLMAGPLSRFNREYPQVVVQLDVGGSNEVERRVSEDECDIGLVFGTPHDAKIVSRTVSRQPVNAIVGPGFPLLGQPGPFDVTEFLPYPLALNHATYGMRQTLRLVEQTEKIRFEPKLVTNSFFVIRQFVRLGLGVTFLPDFVVAAELASGDLISLPLRQPILEGAEVHLITRTGRKLSFGANKMLQYMASGLASLRQTPRRLAPVKNS